MASLNSATPQKVKQHGLHCIRALLCLIAAFSILTLHTGCSRKLTREKAEELLRPAVEKEPPCTTFYWPKEKMVEASKNGHVVGQHPEARLTASGSNLLSGLKLGDLHAGYPTTPGSYLMLDSFFTSDGYLIRLGPGLNRKLDKVTGLAVADGIGVESSGSVMAVEYVFSYRLTPQYERLTPYLVFSRKTQALLRLYDDGWRIEMLGLEGAPQLMAAANSQPATPSDLEIVEMLPPFLTTLRITVVHEPLILAVGGTALAALVGSAFLLFNATRRKHFGAWVLVILAALAAGGATFAGMKYFVLASSGDASSFPTSLEKKVLMPSLADAEAEMQFQKALANIEEANRVLLDAVENGSIQPTVGKDRLNDLAKQLDDEARRNPPNTEDTQSRYQALKEELTGWGGQDIFSYREAQNLFEQISAQHAPYNTVDNFIAGVSALLDIIRTFKYTIEGNKGSSFEGAGIYIKGIKFDHNKTERTNKALARLARLQRDSFELSRRANEMAKAQQATQNRETQSEQNVSQQLPRGSKAMGSGIRCPHRGCPSGGEYLHYGGGGTVRSGTALTCQRCKRKFLAP